MPQILAKDRMVVKCPILPGLEGEASASSEDSSVGPDRGPGQCDIFDEQQHLAARASSTCMTVADERAQGRALARGISSRSQATQQSHYLRFNRTQQVVIT
jgi:hypothetical protein